MLEEIMAHKRKENLLKRALTPIDDLAATCFQRVEKLGFSRAKAFEDMLGRPQISLIAELKKNSPPKGPTRPNFDHMALARAYKRAGADAISIITDENFFHGSIAFIDDVSADTSIGLPILFKDFVCDEYQIYEACISNASAILLIARLLTPKELRDYHELATRLGLAVIVECFDTDDLSVALEVDPKIIGVNNKNLGLFETNFGNTEGLMKAMPTSILTISESGISSRDDVLFMEGLGFSGMLIGNSILAAGNVEKKIHELIGCPAPPAR